MGHYRANRFSHKSLAKLAAAVGAVEVEATENGTLRFLGREWAEAAPLTFREVDGDDSVVFREAEDGSMSHFFVADVPIVAFERVPAGEGPGLHLFIVVFVVSMMVGTVLSWPVGLALRRWYKVDATKLERMPAKHRLVLLTAASLFLVFVLGFSAIMTDPNQIAIAIPGSVRVLLFFPIVAGLLTIVGAYCAVLIWWKGFGRLMGRMMYSAAVVSFVLFIWQLHVWNLLGWRF